MATKKKKRGAQERAHNSVVGQSCSLKATPRGEGLVVNDLQWRRLKRAGGNVCLYPYLHLRLDCSWTDLGEDWAWGGRNESPWMHSSPEPSVYTVLVNMGGCIYLFIH